MRVTKKQSEQAARKQSIFSGHKTSGKAAPQKQPGFEASLEGQEVQLLLSEMDEIAEQLFRFPSRKLLQHYRLLTGKIMYLAEQKYHINRKFNWKRGGNTVMVTIEKTESLLDELEVILTREGERTRLYEVLEEIKGCVISLFL